MSITRFLRAFHARAFFGNALKNTGASCIISYWNFLYKKEEGFDE